MACSAVNTVVEPSGLSCTCMPGSFLSDDRVCELCPRGTFKPEASYGARPTYVPVFSLPAAGCIVTSLVLMLKLIRALFMLFCYVFAATGVAPVCITISVLEASAM